ncbi:MAG TPA: DUF1028 domain-containing protein [Casimicrobiaceae bacterium]|nr:DUF1028 domain-containing protein [Casimicrobiaceae bacterium]
MTWSIVARDSSGALGVAVASRFFAVGSLCPYAESGVGAVATQALVNPHLGPAALAKLAEGDEPAHVLSAVIADDAGRDVRQLHLVDARGRAAAYTGSACIDWCGHVTGENFSVAGNMLAGPRVIGDAADAYRENAQLDFAERLLTAMAAGEAAGGDKRGKQAAALRIVTTERYPALDLRVDDHPEPLRELRRLLAKSLERFQPFVACLPSRANPSGIVDRAVIEREIEAFTARRANQATVEPVRMKP